MDDVITKTNKLKENEINVKELQLENKQDSTVIDTSIFDEILREIDQILKNLEQKSETEQDQLKKFNILPEIKSAISKIHGAKNELAKEENNLIKNNNLIKRIEDLEKNIKNSNETILLPNKFNKEADNEIEEHKIDQNLLSIEELHQFKETEEKKNESTFGFYSYVTLFIIFFFTLYGTLNLSKDLIITKYPMTGPYIQYFNEIIEIVKISIFGLVNFIVNKI